MSQFYASPDSVHAPVIQSRTNFTQKSIGLETANEISSQGEI
jgi:hypothetical protein